MKNIVLIEDDDTLREGMIYALVQEGYQLKAFNSGMKAMAGINHKTDLVIIDIGLPDISGFDVAGRMNRFRDVPFLFLTARDEEEDMVHGYQLGCEDYITKPFSLPILLQKVKVVLRRGCREDDGCYDDGFLFLDFDRHIFRKDMKEISLTGAERIIMKMLLDHAGMVLTKNQLEEAVWGTVGDGIDQNTLAVYIRRLRAKIEVLPSKPQYIVTVFGIGYKWGTDHWV